MSRNPEETEAQLIERERIKTLASDADIIAALNRYDHWVKKSGLNHYDAVSAMLDFMRAALEQGTELRAGLFDRINSNLDEMQKEAANADPRLQYATDYVAEAFRQDRYLINYDPKFYFMLYVIYLSDSIFPKDKRGTLLGTFNSMFLRATLNKIIYIYSLVSPKVDDNGTIIPMTEDDKSEGRELFEVATLKGYYSIPYYSDNIGGRMVWQEGEEIALGIYAFIQKPESRGLLCSLLPPEGPLHVDWSKNDWVYSLEHLGWINYEDPVDLLKYFDQMAAMKGVFT